jgi:iron complex transport system ATP-binding protein
VEVCVLPPWTDASAPPVASRPPAAGRIAVEAAAFATPAGRVLVDGVDMAVGPGERIAIIGPNGAGKTTLLRMLAGHLAPSAGRILLDGAPIDRMAPEQRARAIALVSQNSTPDPRLTVLDYVDLGRTPHRAHAAVATHRRAVLDAIERVGLAHLARRRLDHLSGGERQRAAIARAIAQEPKLLLLDEPTNHLDPRARVDVLDLAAALGATIVTVLHDLDRVAPFADRVAVMLRGRLVAYGPPAEALAPATVAHVFQMHCFETVNPATGRGVLVFDKPAA